VNVYTILVAATGLFSATGTPQPNFNEDSVTPGWVGFVMMFLVALAVILLCIDMVRRVRKVRYRGEIREQLEAEYEAENGPRG
jgi:hypothetical protein